MKIKKNPSVAKSALRLVKGGKKRAPAPAPAQASRSPFALQIEEMVTAFAPLITMTADKQEEQEARRPKPLAFHVRGEELQQILRARAKDLRAHKPGRRTSVRRTASTQAYYQREADRLAWFADHLDAATVYAVTCRDLAEWDL